jgi:pullulanase/glycogen debranching enzyme
MELSTMQKWNILSTLVIYLLLPLLVAADDAMILTPETYDIPGRNGPSPWLQYANAQATNVEVAGSWDKWSTRQPMMFKNGVWLVDVSTLGLPFGKYEYKFIVDNAWEKGANRVLYINADGLLEPPSDLIGRSLVQAPAEIEVFLREPIPEKTPLRVYVSPSVAVAEWHLTTPGELGFPQGYTLRNGSLTFIMSEKLYGLNLTPGDKVTVAGNFNGWDSKPNLRWSLQDRDRNGVWELTLPLQALRVPAGEQDLLFKFVINGKQWLMPLKRAPNYTPDGKKNANLRIDPNLQGSTTILIETETPLDMAQSYMVTIHGLTNRPVYSLTSPGRILDTFYSDKELGVILHKQQNATTYRLFAPRATDVYLCIFDDYRFETYKPEYTKFEPVERYRMWKDPQDGVWEISLRGLDIGKYYSFNVEGNQGEGEGFSPFVQVGDPYARAAAHAENNAIVIDQEATNKWFGGWTDQDWSPPAREDVVIYETHVRHMTIHPSSGVSPTERGKYGGITDSATTDTGLAYLKWLGVNTIEFLPISEFNNGEGGHNWGYTPVFYFAPEGTYAHDPRRGSQYYEYKEMINNMHNHGFGVVMDVVYNHVGWPNIFSLIDRKYFFRLNDDFSFSNFSGCGNDVRTEAPMMRRLIVDNVVYWVNEFHVDGFRFDLAELIDMETMMEIEKAVHAINPDILLISEPWSFRGENKHELTGTGWSAWNNDFRYAAKDFMQGRRNREWLKKCIFGSLDIWAATPLQPVNYLESHDDMALVDELVSHPDRNGKILLAPDVKANKLGATILFTSLGIPMIGEGQEFLRHKEGIHNSYDQGDIINALNWEMRERPLAKAAMNYYRDLIHMRMGPEGASLRLAKRPPDDYYQWLEPKDNAQFLGYLINGKKWHSGRSFIVLLNSSYDKYATEINFPASRWKLIGNGKKVDVKGVGKSQAFSGPRKVAITIPGLTGLIFMDGF